MSITILVFFVVLFALVLLLRVAHIGALAAFLLAGVISGVHGLNLFQLSETWTFLGDLGILFLWFNLGLEINIKRLWQMRHTIFGFGAAQVLMVATMLFPLLYGVSSWTIMGCVMVSLLLAMSSTSEDLQLLADRNEMNTNMGRQTFSILLFQDLLSIPLLAMLPVFAGRTFNLGATAIDVLVMSVALVLGVVIVGRFIINPLMRFVCRSKSKEAFLLAIMVNIAFWAVIMTRMGLPAGLGAFLAGMLMSETIYRHQVTAEISPYAMLFLSFFFISLGMGLNVPFLLSHWYVVLAGLSGLLIIKFTAIFIVARVRHVSIQDAIMIALILSQGGEFGLLMLQTIKSSGINVLPAQHQEILTAVIILSIMTTPILLAIFDRIRLSGGVFNTGDNTQNVSQEKHPDVVICGFGRVGQIVAQILNAQGISYVALDLDVNSVMVGREQGYNVVYGDCRNSAVLTEMGLAPRRTRAVVVALDNASNAHSTVHTIRSVAPRVQIFARARNLADSKALLRDGVQCAFPETIESSFFLARDVLSHFGVSDAKIEQLLSELRSDNYSQVSSLISDNID